jgi:hypothetical protein
MISHEGLTVILILTILSVESLVVPTHTRLIGSKTRLHDQVVETASEVDVSVEMAKLFNRMADKRHLLDVPGAGTPGMAQCCHSGCDSCEFRFLFDEMTAGRAKWVALYSDMKHIDGRWHVAPWARVFFDSIEDFEKAKDEVREEGPYLLTERGDDMAITMQTFISRIQEIPNQLTMGPPSSGTDEMPNTAFLEMFWAQITAAASVDSGGSLTPKQMSDALTALTKTKHAASWKHFSKIEISM